MSDLIYADFHCHLDLFPNPLRAINFFENNKIYAIGVTTTPKALAQNKKWAQNKQFIKTALGLHPQLINSKHFDYNLFLNLIDEAIYIGEIGLDKSKEYLITFQEQRDYFNKILRIISQYQNKVISIHSLKAVDEVLEDIEKYLFKSGNRYILHWFTGTIKQAEKAVSLNCYFSINHKILSNNKGQDLIKFLPLDRIVLESDAPFTMEILSKKYYAELVKSIALIKGESPAIVLNQISKNNMQILKLNSN